MILPELNFVHSTSPAVDYLIPYQYPQLSHNYDRRLNAKVCMKRGGQSARAEICSEGQSGARCLFSMIGDSE
jgi:hypothetical protein